MSDDTAMQDIYSIIGTIVARLLKPDGELHLQDIVSSLHNTVNRAQSSLKRKRVRKRYACFPDSFIKMMKHRTSGGTDTALSVQGDAL
ncbi:hypothetical protein, partial [Pantoea sp. SGAir0180]